MKNPALNHLLYRADIDGLRALAVLSVVCYHAFPQIFTGGFVGVDVFFVISGFLITTIILNDVQNQGFSFLEFYARRIKRIFPALILVLFFSLALGWFVLLPHEYKELGGQVAGGATFVSNFLLWRQAGYFDSAADGKILLHLWSLGVEEQYYFIWPALVWASWKRKYNFVFICAALLLASFLLNINTVRVHTVAAFYSPLSRFWELFSGGLLAYLTQALPKDLARGEFKLVSWFQKLSFHPEKYRTRNKAALLGLCLLLSAELLLVKTARFPGWWAVLPTLGAYLMILAGPQSWLNRKLLAHPVLVWFGLISYPLYLWHWPLLVFTKIIQDQTPSPLLRLLAVLTSIALAWLTYRLIEKPVRFGRHHSAKVVILCALMLAVGGAGKYYDQHQGLGFRLKDKNDYAAYFDAYLYDGSQFTEEREKISQNHCNRYQFNSQWANETPRAGISPECYAKPTKHAVMLWGDSHAAHLYYGLKTVLPKEVSTLLAFSSGCKARRINQENIDKNYCDQSNYLALKLAKEKVPEVVMLASNDSFEIDYIRELAHTLKQYGVKKVYVLGVLPHWKPYLYVTVVKHFWQHTPKRIAGYQNEELLSADQRFRAQMKADEEFEYVNLYQFFCNAEGCLTYLGEDKREGLITRDDAHLRPFASVYLAKKLLAPLVLREVSTQG